MLASIIQNKKQIVLSDIKPNNVRFDNIKPRLISNKSVITPVHIARVGNFKGYRDGEFELTSNMFNQMINNFDSEKTPLACYRGHADIVGSINGEEPQNCGWILALKNDGQNLWALCEFTDDMAEQLKEGKYKFASIYMKSNDIHRETGEEIGCRLASLAITAQPFVDGLSAISLSQNIQTPNIYFSSKEESIKMTKDQMTKVSEDAVCAETIPMQDIQKTDVAQEQMDKMQEGKTMDQNPMTMLEQAKSEVNPDMPIEAFVKHLLDLFKAELAEAQAETGEEEAVKIAEESTLTSSEDVANEKKDMSKEEEKMVASNVALSSTVKSLNLALSNLKKENEVLKGELAKEKEMILSAIVSDAVAKGKLLDTEKEVFIKLGTVDRKIFNELLAARNHKPSVVLSRITSPDSSERTVENKQKNLSEIEKKILKGANIKF